jgi:hypothetical protein
MTPQEKMFLFLKEKGLTKFDNYEAFRNKPRHIDKIKTEQKKFKEIVIDKVTKRKAEYNEWKAVMTPEEKKAFEYALES